MNNNQILINRIYPALMAQRQGAAPGTPAYLLNELVERAGGVDGPVSGLCLLAESFSANYENTCNGAFGSVRLNSDDEMEHVLGDGIHLTPESLLALYEGTDSIDYYSMLIEDKRAAEQAAA